MDALTTQTAPGDHAPSLDRSDSATVLIELLQRAGAPSDEIDLCQRRLQSLAWTPIAAATWAHLHKLLDEDEYHLFLSNTCGWRVLSEISPGSVDPDFTRLIPIGFARRHGLIGLDMGDGLVSVATSDLNDVNVIDYVGAWLRKPVVYMLAPADVIQQAINAAYTDCESDFGSVLGETDTASDVVEALQSLDVSDLLDSATRAPVIKLVNMVLFEAVKTRVSDVHIQPLADRVQVRYRIDGVLYDKLDLPRPLLDEVVSRIKVIGQMDIAEKRLSQDGRTTVAIGDKSIDLRISVIPTSHGERVVIRLLDKSARLYELGELGMSARDRSRFTDLLDRTHGIILVTGPTGSGKSTTLYAALQHLDCTEKNILTLEDPIEYQLPGISQTQVATRKGMTFATGLRAVLRQDPDIIMVGEIRDEETARMAVQSSMTGHLVFSTLHTNDAAGAVTRLLDLGIEPYLVASSLLAVLAQRLVRIVCPNCREAVEAAPADIRALGLGPTSDRPTLYRARQCELCAHTGYLGRQGIFEFLTVDDEIRELVVARAKSNAIKQRAVAGGMTTLRQDGVERVLRGQTTLEELSRTTYQDDETDPSTAACGAAPVDVQD